MNSPPDPGSPSVSTPSSGSPPPEEANTQPSNASSHFMGLASHITSAFSGSSSSKRRLPGGTSFGASSSNRDSKTRRRGDAARSTGGGSSVSGNWDGTKDPSRREKEDLVDNHIVEILRKEIGDPFQEAIIKKFH